MARVTNTIRIDGVAPAVFDLVTTARFWPQWHPATTGVGGVTQRPFQRGDTIREQAQIGSHTYEGNWTVIEHERPRRATLQMGSGRLCITYTLEPDGNGVRLQRELDFHPQDFAASVSDGSKVEPLMHAQSEQALHKLKALVERILGEEAI